MGQKEECAKDVCGSLAMTASLDAIEAGGDDPFDIDGECMLPRGPQERDWEWFESEFKRIVNREASEEEKDQFYSIFSQEMEDAIYDLLDKDDNDF